MSFSDLTFLFYFLPLFFAVYYILPFRFKNAALVLGSFAFYFIGAGARDTLLLSGVLLLHYALARAMAGKEVRTRKALLIIALAADLFCLVYFKYAAFILENLGKLTGTAFSLVELALPLGVSFYLFQSAGYLIDVYRGEEAEKNLIDYAAFTIAFPQLTMGPILRYREWRGALKERTITREDVFSGFELFVVGLCFKVLLADQLAPLWASLERIGYEYLSTPLAWLGAVSYSLQLYFDFSGYSDMAIGMGRIFGFKYPENFRLPYTSRSITEFWRRWHISLGSFFRDYVYIPLGGKKKHHLLNMAVVWALTGLWHGASWNFVLWGLYFFVILAAEKTIGEKRLRRIPTILRRVGTMLLVILGWNIFYFTDLTQLLQHFGLLFGLLGAGFSNAQTGIQLVNNLPLLLVCAIGATSVPQNLGNLFGGVCVQGGKRSGQIVYACVTFAFDAALLALSTIALVGSTYNAFLYFRF